MNADFSKKHEQEAMKGFTQALYEDVENPCYNDIKWYSVWNKKELRCLFQMRKPSGTVTCTCQWPRIHLKLYWLSIMYGELVDQQETWRRICQENESLV